jgi:hypothetical protein
VETVASAETVAFGETVVERGTAASEAFVVYQEIVASGTGKLEVGLVAMFVLAHLVGSSIEANAAVEKWES